MPNARPLVYVIDWFKTINRKAKRNTIAKDVGYDARNLRYDTEYGSLSKRLSRAKYNSTSLGTSQIKGMHRYYKNSTDSASLLVVYGGALKTGYDNAGVFSNITTGLNATNYHTFLTYKDFEYIFNGIDNNKVFTNTSKLLGIEDMGVPSHTHVPSATLSATAGSLNGSYQYALALQFDGYQEGNATASCPRIALNGSIGATINFYSSANSRCTGFYLYRTRADGAVLYRLATISGNANKTYADTNADTILDTTRKAPIDYGVPTANQFSCLHKERIFLAQGSTVIFSDIRNGIAYPDIFPSTNTLYIGKDDGDDITGILNDHMGQVVVLKKNSVRVINTNADSPLSWDISGSYSVQGNVAPFSAATIPGGILYVTRYGEDRKRIVLWTGSGIQVIPQLEGIETELTAIPATALIDVRGHYHNGYYYLAYRTEGEYNDKVLIVNTLDWSVEIDDKNVAAFCSWIGGNDFGELYTGSSDQTGTVYREDADEFDLLVKYKSELDAGVKSNTQTTGTEGSPSMGMSTVTATSVGYRTWDSMTGATDTWQAMTAADETWWFTAEWYDDVRDISAKILSALYWNEYKATDTVIVFYVRTGDTESACLAASWNGPYTNAGGSDLTSVTAAKYIQVWVRFAVKNASDYDDVWLMRRGTGESDYVFKISANYGTPAEATIEFNWESGRIDLGDINEAYKRLRKRIRSVKVEYERAELTGGFDFSLYLNGSSTSIATFNTQFNEYPTERYYNFATTTFGEDFLYKIYSDTDNKALKIKKVVFTVSVEPYFVRR